MRMRLRWLRPRMKSRRPSSDRRVFDVAVPYASLLTYTADRVAFNSFSSLGDSLILRELHFPELQSKNNPSHTIQAL